MYLKRVTRNAMKKNKLSAKERVLKGIKLPKNKDQWNIANDFFIVALPVNDPIENIDDTVQTLQRIIYNYFKSNYGNVAALSRSFRIRTITCQETS